MKRAGRRDEARAGASPPARGAWIETSSAKQTRKRPKSPPARGAWIETVYVSIRYIKKKVAPRAGGVD